MSGALFFNSDSSTNLLCDFGQVADPLWVSVCSSEPRSYLGLCVLTTSEARGSPLLTRNQAFLGRGTAYLSPWGPRVSKWTLVSQAALRTRSYPALPLAWSVLSEPQPPPLPGGRGLNQLSGPFQLWPSVQSGCTHVSSPANSACSWGWDSLCQEVSIWRPLEAET